MHAKGEAECSDRTLGSEKPDLVSTEGRLQLDVEEFTFLISSITDDTYRGAVKCCGTV